MDIYYSYYSKMFGCFGIIKMALYSSETKEKTNLHCALKHPCVRMLFKMKNKRQSPESVGV